MNAACIITGQQKYSVWDACLTLSGLITTAPSNKDRAGLKSNNRVDEFVHSLPVFGDALFRSALEFVPGLFEHAH